MRTGSIATMPGRKRRSIGSIVIIALAIRRRYAPAMRRAAAIVLVLMGGGVLLMNVARPWSRCREAREHQLADADEICRQSGYSGGGHFFTHGTSGETASVSRGGFGASGHAAHGS